MTDELNNTQVDLNGPPPTTEPVSKGQPHHVEARLASLEPELKDLFEKNIADKVATERNYRNTDAELRKTQQKLNDMMKEKQEAENQRLAEQGKYKELAEAAERRVRELEEGLTKRDIQSSLDRELMSAGALDSELIATAIQAKYADELKADPSKATELVARLKEAKPLLFKQVAAAGAAPVIPAPKSTGAADIAPQAGQNPSNFDALDKKTNPREVERRYREAMKNANWFSS